MTEPTPKFEDFPTTSPNKRKARNRWFWLLCVASSTSSVVILLVLIFSILVQSYPAFVAPVGKFNEKIIAVQQKIAELNQEKQSASDVAAIESQIEDLTAKLNSLEANLQSSSTQSFLTKAPSPEAGKAGIGPALMGSIWVCAGCAFFFFPLGVGTAIFLEEFRPTNRFLRSLSGVLQLNISNLAGVPSIVYGILGLTVFANMFGMFGNPGDPAFEFGTHYKRQYITEGMQIVFVPVQRRDEVPTLSKGMSALKPDGTSIALHIIGENDEFPSDEATLRRSLLADATGGVVPTNAWYAFRLPLGRSVLAASLTLMLVILPVVIIATQESLRAVPSSLREGAMGLGCTRWQVVRHVSLPAAIPGIMTGSILAMSRAIGEAAPILMISGIVSIATGPRHLMDDFSILPLQIFYWAGLPIDPDLPLNFQHVAAGAIIVLLLVLFAFNSAAILIRQIAQKQLT
jgi:phosphate transport system permease protein